MIKQIALGILIVVAFIAFAAWMQTTPELCDGLGFPVCTGGD